MNPFELDWQSRRARLSWDAKRADRSLRYRDPTVATIGRRLKAKGILDNQRCSASARSCSRPQASLFCFSIVLEMNGTFNPSRLPYSREAQASSKVTPDRKVIRSIRLGDTPS